MTKSAIAACIVLALLTSSCGGGSADESVIAAQEAVASVQATPEPAAVAETPTVVAEPTAIEDETLDMDPDDGDDEAAAAGDDPDSDARPDGPQWAQIRQINQSGQAHLTGDIPAVIGTSLPAWLEPDTYTTSVLGPDLSFTLSEPLPVYEEYPGHLLFIAEPGSQTAGVLFLTRPTGIFDGEAALDANALVPRRYLASPLPEDLGVWLGSSDGVIVGDVSKTTVDGVDTTRYEISVEPDTGYFCQVGRCRNLLIAGPTQQPVITLWEGQDVVVWEVEQPGDDIVFIAKAVDDPSGWFEKADELISTIELGEPRPSPLATGRVFDSIADLEPGDYLFEAVRWVEATPDVPVNINHALGFLKFREAGVRNENHISLFRVKVSLEGEALSTVDEVVQAIVDNAGVELTELPAEQILGFDSRVLVGPVGTPGVRFYFAFGLANGELFNRNFAYTEGVGDEMFRVFERGDEIWVAVSNIENGEESAFAQSAWGWLAVQDQETEDAAPVAGLSELAPGRWAFDTLGTAMELDTGIDLSVPVNESGAIILQGQAAAAQGLPTRILGVVRVASYADESELTGLPADGQYSLDGDDFESWLQAMTAGDAPLAVVASASEDGATRADLRLDGAGTETIEGGCGQPDGRCFAFLTTGSFIDPLIVRAGEVYRIWVVHQGATGSDLVFFAATEVGDEEWLDIAQTIVDSAELGEPAPHPVP